MKMKVIDDKINQQQILSKFDNVLVLYSRDFE